ncbi:hypothetical protein ATANTOWER_005433 [Ataeniobius toweri]|uniref:Uncharacterized protein n=1 Tax=Ataeniobius toweri TaxID=208326 RepID=A0ABU7C9C2_9TELE|nr:hypothetical protein [Ataeniobius toweri]
MSLLGGESSGKGRVGLLQGRDQGMCGKCRASTNTLKGHLLLSRQKRGKYDATLQSTETTRKKLVSLGNPLWIFTFARVSADRLQLGYGSSDLLISDRFSAFQVLSGMGSVEQN